MPPDEFGDAIQPSVVARGQRKSGEVTGDVIAQCARGRIALRRILTQRFQHDAVEIAGKLPAKLACGRDGTRTKRLLGRKSPLPVRARRTTELDTGWRS